MRKNPQVDSAQQNTMTRREKTDNLVIWREKLDFSREINIKMAVSFSRKFKKACQKRMA